MRPTTTVQTTTTEHASFIFGATFLPTMGLSSSLPATVTVVPQSPQQQSPLLGRLKNKHVARTRNSPLPCESREIELCSSLPKLQEAGTNVGVNCRTYNYKKCAKSKKTTLALGSGGWRTKTEGFGPVDILDRRANSRVHRVALCIHQR